MGWGKKLKKSLGKAINKITGGSKTLNKILGIAFPTVTGGASMVAAKEASDLLIKQAQAKEAGIRAAEEEKAAGERLRQKEYADFERKILGQRSQRIENESQSRTDFTSDLEEDIDPRSLKQDRLLAKKRKLIGFE